MDEHPKLRSLNHAWIQQLLRKSSVNSRETTACFRGVARSGDIISLRIGDAGDKIYTFGEGEKMKKKSYLAVGIVIAIAIISYAAYTLAVPRVVAKESFYVVAFRWGFAIYDEKGNYIDQIVVRKGTELTLYGVSEEAKQTIPKLPKPVGDAIERTDFHHLAEELKLIPKEVLGNKTVYELIEEAEEAGYLDHGLGIPEFGVVMTMVHDASEPVKVTFIANKIGEFEFACTVYCGVGHDYMVQKKLKVVE